MNRSASSANRPENLRPEVNADWPNLMAMRPLEHWEGRHLCGNVPAPPVCFGHRLPGTPCSAYAVFADRKLRESTPDSSIGPKCYRPSPRCLLITPAAGQRHVLKFGALQP